MLKIIMRVDASIQIGVGHMMRCLTLANELNKIGADISFVCRDYPGNFQSLIQKQGFFVKLLPNPNTIKHDDKDYSTWLGVPWEQDVEDVKKVLCNKIVDWIIVDHYGVDHHWHKSFRGLARNIMVIDDLADRKLNCDVILDQTFNLKKNVYLPFLLKKSQLLIGTDYALLRPEFIKLRLEAIEKRKQSNCIECILVSMGSVDPNNLSARVLEALAKVKWKKKPTIDLVISSRAPELKSIIDQSKKLKLDINVLQDVENMSDLMLKADLAIGAGGTTSWERCCLGLPSLLVRLAANQKQVIAELVKAGAAKNISNIENDIIRECNYLNKNKLVMFEMSKNAFKVVNGQGAALVAIRMQPNLAKDGGNVTIRNANVLDVNVTYKWQTNLNTRKYFHESKIPDYDEHVKWFKKNLAEPADFFYIIEHKNQAIGVLQLYYKGSSLNNYYLVSIYVSPKHYKLGIASIALEYINRLFHDSELHAEIFEENIASKNLFMKSGYTKSNDCNLYIKNSK